MKIIDATWRPLMNVLTVKCDCGKEDTIPANRRWFVCKKCGRQFDMLREKNK